MPENEMHPFIKLTKVVLDQPSETPKEYIYLNIDNITCVIRSAENKYKKTRVFTVDPDLWFEVMKLQRLLLSTRG
ncbi:hypothetical protein LCGC14_2001370 [marine sediment metagenome]|uniref:Uncharacterized protein n=1 Tax=marine sediment metagenome TaxID=412755 RepID=A0A0F9F320_9ZZZZ